MWRLTVIIVFVTLLVTHLHVVKAVANAGVILVIVLDLNKDIR